MASIIEQVIKSADFESKVVQELALTFTSKQADAYSKDGLIEGSVTEYEITSEIKFDTAEGSGLIWTVPFSASGTATIGFKSPDGEYGDDTVDGPCEGLLEISFSEDVLNLSDVSEIIESLEIEVTESSAQIDAREPVEIEG